MTASAIAISSNSSDESVGSSPSRVSVFGNIPTVIPSTSVVAPETSTITPVISSAALVVETTLVASPTRLCGLDPYVATVARWRSRVTTRLSSSSKFPIAYVTAPPGIRRRSAILIRPGEAIPFGRPYRTHLNRSRKLLTARKRVGPLPARRLACSHASPRSSDHHSSSSSLSLDSLPVHSSGLDASDQAHSGSSTRDIDPIKTEVDVELGIGDGDDVRDHVAIGPRDVSDGDTVEVGIDPMSTPIVEEEIVEPAGEDSSNSSSTRDGIFRSFKDMPIDLNDVVRDFDHHMSEVRIDRIVRIQTVQRRLEAD
ncbi:hypothetical protein Tco_0575528 [Tanacetum coccineum]